MTGAILSGSELLGGDMPPRRSAAGGRMVAVPPVVNRTWQTGSAVLLPAVVAIARSDSCVVLAGTGA
jgi:hypothetical protein